jgi:hypothetical protein
MTTEFPVSDNPSRCSRFPGSRGRRMKRDTPRHWCVQSCEPHARVDTPLPPLGGATTLTRKVGDVTSPAGDLTLPSPAPKTCPTPCLELSQGNLQPEAPRRFSSIFVSQSRVSAGEHRPGRWWPATNYMVRKGKVLIDLGAKAVLLVL